MKKNILDDKQIQMLIRRLQVWVPQMIEKYRQGVIRRNNELTKDLSETKPEKMNSTNSPGRCSGRIKIPVVARHDFEHVTRRPDDRRASNEREGVSKVYSPTCLDR